MTSNPLIEGFRIGLLLPTSEELELHDLHDLTRALRDSLCIMPPPSPTHTIEQLAERWKCSTRTIRRMQAAGVDVEDALAVARHLAALRSPSSDMIDRAIAALDELAD
jgi:hypothetical protein